MWKSNIAIPFLMLFTLPSYGGEIYKTGLQKIRVGASYLSVDVAGIPRAHDYGPSGAFVDPQNGAPRLATIITASPNGVNTVLSGFKIPKAGVANRFQWGKNSVLVANLPGEGPPNEACRSQASSYYLSPDIPLVWRLKLTLGDGGGSSYGWPLASSGVDPALIWQVKAPDIRPSLTAVVDTDTEDPAKVMLVFSQRAGMSERLEHVGIVRGLSVGRMMDIQIEALLDERDNTVGGKGYWRAWVDGSLVMSKSGPTLDARARSPHQWFFGLYRFQTTCSSSLPRVTQWGQVSLELLGP